MLVTRRLGGKRQPYTRNELYAHRPIAQRATGGVSGTLARLSPHCWAWPPVVPLTMNAKTLLVVSALAAVLPLRAGEGIDLSGLPVRKGRRSRKCPPAGM